MKISFNLHILGITAATALLVGCGGSPTPQTGTQALPSKSLRLRHADGGAFSAHYSGFYSPSDCNVGLMPNFGFNPFSDYRGEGHASFLQASGEVGITFVGREPPCNQSSGSFDMVSAKSPHDTIELYTDVSFDGKWTYKVIGGTGRFAKATGSGTWAFTITGDYYEDTWTGTLNF